MPDDALTLRFRIREAPEGWYLFFHDLQWGPAATREELVALAQDMAQTVSKEFGLPIQQEYAVRQPRKELMPWVKGRKRGKR